MSDHDRGAYTPNTDAPLSFDARQSRGRRAFPTTLLISLVVLIGLTLAIFMFYRSGVRGAGEAPVPVGTPVGEIKSPPPAQAQQPPAAGQGLQIYKAEGNAEAPASSAPAAAFAPPPEQPQARPVVPVPAQPIAPAKPAPAAVAVAADPTAVTPPPPAAASKPKPTAVAAVQAPTVAVTPAKPAPTPPAKAVATAPAKAVVTPPAKAVVAASKPAPKDEVGALLNAKPAPVEVKKVDAPKAPAKAPPPAKAETASIDAARGAAVVQFGAFSSTDLASSEWLKLARAYPAEMEAKGKLVESIDRDGKTLFRGAVAGFASRADAVAFCAKLKADGRACIVR